MSEERKINEAPGHPMRLDVDHISTWRGTSYSRAGDVVEFIRELPGHYYNNDTLQAEPVTRIIYRDTCGELFACHERMIRPVPAGTKLKKQFQSPKK